MQNRRHRLLTLVIMGIAFSLLWTVSPGGKTPSSGADDRHSRDYRPARILMIIGFFVVHVALVLIAFIAILSGCKPLFQQISGLLGVIAFGSGAAFFTACLNAMERVPYERPVWKRGVKCVYAASQLEAVFRMLVGVSVGGGSYLLVFLTRS